MDISLSTHQNYINRPISDLPTPAFIVSRPVLENNIKRLHADVEQLGIDFRPHVKTLKTIEVTRLMLGGGKYRKIVASTLAEIRGVLPLVKEGMLDEALYSLPIRPSALPELDAFTKQSLRIVLMVDHEDHIDILEQYASRTGRTAPWDVFVKIDVGTRRAGLTKESSRLDALLSRASKSPAVSIYGFYCHAGHSYASKNVPDALKALEEEFDGVFTAASKLDAASKQNGLVLSIGSTPTAHVVAGLKRRLESDNMKLELHAGNFPANDLQQVATGLVTTSDQAVRLLTEVCSVYPERNEALINAGSLALTKETGPISGLARVVDKMDWAIVRVSQEHGIIGWAGEEGKPRQEITDHFKVGQQVLLYTQHACIAAAMYHVYYVVDEKDIIRETWLPWKGW